LSVKGFRMRPDVDAGSQGNQIHPRFRDPNKSGQLDL
jgi:hypothetical protein